MDQSPPPPQDPTGMASFGALSPGHDSNTSTSSAPAKTTKRAPKGKVSTKVTKAGANLKRKAEQNAGVGSENGRGAAAEPGGLVFAGKSTTPQPQSDEIPMDIDTNSNMSETGRDTGSGNTKTGSPKPKRARKSSAGSPTVAAAAIGEAGTSATATKSVARSPPSPVTTNAALGLQFQEKQKFLAKVALLEKKIQSLEQKIVNVESKLDSKLSVQYIFSVISKYIRSRIFGILPFGPEEELPPSFDFGIGDDGGSAHQSEIGERTWQSPDVEGEDGQFDDYGEAQDQFVDTVDDSATIATTSTAGEFKVPAPPKKQKIVETEPVVDIDGLLGLGFNFA